MLSGFTLEVKARVAVSFVGFDIVVFYTATLLKEATGVDGIVDEVEFTFPGWKKNNTPAKIPKNNFPVPKIKFMGKKIIHIKIFHAPEKILKTRENGKLIRFQINSSINFLRKLLKYISIQY